MNSPSFKIYLDQVMYYRYLDVKSGSLLVEFPITTSNPEGQFVLDNDTILTIEVIKGGAQELDSNLVQIRPRIFYRDIELAIVGELIERDNFITIFESLRFIDGVLNI